jgi:acetyl-CoA synthetase
VQRGDRVLLMLGNEVPLWELMLACIKLGAVVIPATTLLAATTCRTARARGRAGDRHQPGSMPPSSTTCRPA